MELSFIHIPKNAGSSIEFVGKEHGYRWGMNIKFSKYKIGSNPLKGLGSSSIWHIPPKLIKQNKGYEIYFKNKTPFCVVRNPYTRAVSEYKYHEVINGNKTSVEGLNNFITKIPDLLKKDYYYFGCHLLPQSTYTHIPKNNKWEQQKEEKTIEILRFENLQEDFDYLMKKYNYPIETELPFKLRTFITNITEKDLNQESKRIISLVYSEDFINFNYNL